MSNFIKTPASFGVFYQVFCIAKCFTTYSWNLRESSTFFVEFISDWEFKCLDKAAVFLVLYAVLKSNVNHKIIRGVFLGN